MSAKRVRKPYIVRQYSMDGGFVRDYGSYQEAAEANGLKVICIQQVCYGKKRSLGGFLWRKGAKEELPERVGPVRREPASFEAKPVRQLTLKGEFVAIYASVNRAAKAVGRGRKDVLNAILGRQKTCAGYLWEFVSEEEWRMLCHSVVREEGRG